MLRVQCFSLENESSSPEAELWAELFSFVGTAGRRLRWELSELLCEPGCGTLTETHWQRLRALLMARHGEYVTPAEAEEALAAQHKQVRSATVERRLLRKFLEQFAAEMCCAAEKQTTHWLIGFIRCISNLQLQQCYRPFPKSSDISHR